MIIKRIISSSSPHPTDLRCAALCVCMLLTTPVQAESTTDTSPTIKTSPERAIDRAELLDHLDEVRRQYPALYDRLRRGPKPSATVEASTALPPRSIETLLGQETKQDTPPRKGGNP